MTGVTRLCGVWSVMIVALWLSTDGNGSIPGWDHNTYYVSRIVVRTHPNGCEIRKTKVVDSERGNLDVKSARNAAV